MIFPVTGTIPPAITDTSFTLNVKVPVAWAFEKVNTIGALLKSTNTPPVLSDWTVPVSVAENVEVLLPLIPVGNVNVTRSVND